MDLIAELREAVGARHVLTDPDVRAGYERDWTGRFAGRAAAVVAPADTAGVRAVLAACAGHGAAVIPQGGNTGLTGASVPRDGGPEAERAQIVLSLKRLDEIGPVDRAAGQVAAGAGATLAALQAAARAAGADATLDFASRDSCTLGGIAACDAGGAQALRHGTARAHVAGLEAVLADGTVVSRMAGLSKDNAGYDLAALLIGSEGTLGIITAVRWRLAAPAPSRVTALVALESVAQAAGLLAALRADAPSLDSCDFFMDDGLELVLAHQRRSSPVARRAPVYVLAECAAASDPTDELATALAHGGVDDALIADDTASRAGLWSLREGHADAINAAGVPHKLDVGIPLHRLAEFLNRVRAVVAVAPVGAERRAILFGHLGDGNVHVNVLGAPPDDQSVDDAVLELVLACEGTISAEHGVGVAKARWLERARGAGEVAAMRAVKRALDPAGLLNPGAVLPYEDPRP